MTEAKKILKQAAIQIGAGGSAGKYNENKKIHIKSYFIIVLLHNNRFCGSMHNASIRSSEN